MQKNENSINRSALVDMIASRGNFVVGTDENGKALRCRNLVVHIEKQISEADIQRIMIDGYQETRLLYSLWGIMELDGSDVIVEKYKEAFNKILWLNQYGRSFGFESFITKYVDGDNLMDIKDVVDSFHMAIRYPLLTNYGSNAVYFREVSECYDFQRGRGVYLQNEGL